MASREPALCQSKGPMSCCLAPEEEMMQQALLLLIVFGIAGCTSIGPGTREVPKDQSDP